MKAVVITSRNAESWADALDQAQKILQSRWKPVFELYCDTSKFEEALKTMQSLLRGKTRMLITLRARHLISVAEGRLE